MPETKECPSCKEQVRKDALKCEYCHEAFGESSRQQPVLYHDLLHSLLEFLGKLVFPLAIVSLVLNFESTIKSVLGKATTAEFLGVSIQFSQSSGYEGELTPLELYHLIGSVGAGGTRYEGERAKNIDNLVEKGLATIEVEERTSGSPEMQGIWAEVEPTAEGKSFLRNIGVDL